MCRGRSVSGVHMQIRSVTYQVEHDVIRNRISIELIGPDIK